MKLLFFLHWRLNFAFNLLKGKSKYFPCLIASIKVGKSDLGKTNLQSDFNFRLQQLLLFWLWAWNGKSAGLIIGNFDLRSAFHFQLFNLTFPTTIGKCPNPVQLFARIRLLTQLILVNMRTKARNITKWKKLSETWFRNLSLKGEPITLISVTITLITGLLVWKSGILSPFAKSKNVAGTDLDRMGLFL